MIDAHAHLDDPKIIAELDAVIARAGAAGIDRILSCGQDLASSEHTLALARRHSAVRVAVGVHPHRAASWSDDIEGGLCRLAQDERVVAIGEIGIDLSGRSAPRGAQEQAFAAQLALARELELPVVVHVRDAGVVPREVIDRVGRARGMIHCYSEGPDEVGEWLRRGFLISFAGPVTYPKNDALRRAAAVVPMESLLVETDAPYLAPQGRRGQRNEPAFVLETLAAVAAARSETPQRLGAAIADNARRLFGARWA